MQQVEEKWGTPRYGEPSDSLPRDERERIRLRGDEVVAAAFAESMRTCERCGATPASLRMGAPVKTVCGSCRNLPYPWSR